MTPVQGEQLSIPAGLPRTLECALQRYGTNSFKSPMATVLDPNGKVTTTLTYGKLLSRAQKIALYIPIHCHIFLEISRDPASSLVSRVTRSPNLKAQHPHSFKSASPTTLIRLFHSTRILSGRQHRKGCPAHAHSPNRHWKLTLTEIRALKTGSSYRLLSNQIQIEEAAWENALHCKTGGLRSLRSHSELWANWVGEPPRLELGELELERLENCSTQRAQWEQREENWHWYWYMLFIPFTNPYTQRWKISTSMCLLFCRLQKCMRSIDLFGDFIRSTLDRLIWKNNVFRISAFEISREVCEINEI